MRLTHSITTTRLFIVIVYPVYMIFYRLYIGYLFSFTRTYHYPHCLLIHHLIDQLSYCTQPIYLPFSRLSSTIQFSQHLFTCSNTSIYLPLTSTTTHFFFCLFYFYQALTSHPLTRKPHTFSLWIFTLWSPCHSSTNPHTQSPIRAVPSSHPSCTAHSPCIHLIHLSILAFPTPYTSLYVTDCVGGGSEF